MIKKGEIKKGDWFVCLRIPSGHYEVGDLVQVIDVSDYNFVSYQKNNHTEICNWCYGDYQRLATRIEINNHLLKMEINNLKIGDKIQALCDYPSGGKVKKNEIGTIQNATSHYYSVNFPSQSGYQMSKPVSSNYKVHTIDLEDYKDLEKIKVKYPIGTKFKCPLSNVNHIITSSCKYEMTSSGPIVYPISGSGRYLYLIYEKKWAEIITPSNTSSLTDLLLEGRKRGYDKGINIRCIKGEFKGRVFTLPEGCLFIDGNNICFGKPCDHFTIYTNGEWADIITSIKDKPDQINKAKTEEDIWEELDELYDTFTGNHDNDFVESTSILIKSSDKSTKLIANCILQTPIIVRPPLKSNKILVCKG